jgi:hypothetical protein
MNKNAKIIVVTLLAVCVMLLLSGCVTPGPTEMSIIVINAPEDLDIQIVYHEDLPSFFRARISRRLWETRFRFHLSEHPATSWHHEEITISARSSEFGEFEVTFPRFVAGRYSIRLDLRTQTISNADSHGRNLGILLLWLIPLFGIDSAIFYLFGHREKRSWKMFILINLTMQGLFFEALALYYIGFSGELIMGIVTLSILTFPLARVVKLVVEITIYRRVITERSEITGTTWRTTLCVVVMNLLGSIATIVLGMTLPVLRL